MAAETLLWLCILLIINAKTSSIFLCNDTNDCSHKILTCDQNQDCSITCSGSIQSCKNSTVLCPSGANGCSLNCDGAAEYQCESATVNAIEISGGNLTINIDSVYGFHRGEVSCPHIGDCVIKSKGGRALTNTIINAAHTVYGSLSITDSGTDRNAQSMTAYCPQNGDCVIDVGKAYAACYDCTIVAQSSTALLSISAKGTQALSNAEIICPRKNGDTVNCIIADPGDYEQKPYVHYEDALNSMKIKSVESLTNVALQCKFRRCYDESNPPQIYCMEDYSEVCELSRVSDTQWQCVDIDNPCNSWTPDTTEKPNSSPTSLTTVTSTNDSTNTITIDPSNYATIATMVLISTVSPISTYILDSTITSPANTVVSIVIPKSYMYSGGAILCMLCIITCGYIYYKERINGKLNQEIQRQNTKDNNTKIPKQMTITLTPPGIGDLSLTIPKYMSVVNDEDHIEINIYNEHQEGEEPLAIDDSFDDNDVLNEALSEVLRTQSSVMSSNSDAIDENVVILPKYVQLKHWLNAHRLGHYLDNFIMNGYESLDNIKNINDVWNLMDIGIRNEEDQNKLMNLIRLQLNNTVVDEGESNIQMHVVVTSY